MMNITAFLLSDKNPNQHTHECKCCAPKLSFSWWHTQQCHHYQTSFRRLLTGLPSGTQKKMAEKKELGEHLAITALNGPHWIKHPCPRHLVGWPISLSFDTVSTSVGSLLQLLDYFHSGRYYYFIFNLFLIEDNIFIWTTNLIQQLSILMTFSFTQTSRSLSKDKAWQSRRKFKEMYSSSPLSMGDTCHDPQRKHKTTDSTKLLYTLFFPYT